MTQQTAFADEPADELSAGVITPEERSLTDSVMALFDDGKTYVQAEVAFQKTRAAFALDRGKSGLIYAVIAAFLGHLALVAIVIGALLTLSPLIGPLAATLAVVLVLCLIGLVTGFAAKRRFSRLAEVYRDTRE